MSDDDLGLSEREKELKRWNAPYRFKPFPKMVYRGRTVGGRCEVEQRIIASEQEQAVAAEHGWVDHPTAAIEAEDQRQEAPGIAAAERAYRDQFMSDRARWEAAEADAATGRHLGEIAEQPVKRSHKAKTGT